MKRILVIVLFALVFPHVTHAQDFNVSGWIPYWSLEDGIADARDNIDKLTTIHPFGYVVKKDGSLNDMAELGTGKWKKLLKEARAKGVQIIPTIMTSDTEGIHTILSDNKLRAKHIKEIVKIVSKGKFDGVDIDYEGKKAETREYFSTFLTELRKALGDKVLSCTIEPRTPPASLYKKIPDKLEYVNDYEVIGRVCDRVNIMAYDQMRADLKLNEAKSGEPYYPVSDTDWVKKVIDLAKKTIPKEKLILGVATYGREYEVTASKDAFSYKRLWSLSHNYALDLAKDLGIESGRNRAGEVSYSYIATTSSVVIPKSIKAPKSASSGMETAYRALAYARKTGKDVTFNLVWWSDAEAIGQKIDLAKSSNLAGVALFKIDNKEDEGVWDMVDKLAK